MISLQKTVVIYLDVLLFVNAVINFTILFLTCRISGAELSKPRLFFATALSSLYGLVVCLPKMTFLLNFFVKAAVAALTVFIAFDFRGRKIFLKRLVIFIFVTYAYIGLVTAAQRLPGGGSAFIMQNGEIYYNLPLPFLIASAAALFMTWNIVSRHFSKKIKSGDTVACRAVFFGRETSFDGFCDSGNFLTEPISGLPVVICNPAVFEDILPPSAPGETVFERLEKDENFKRRLRVVPYSGAENRGGVITGIRPDAFFAGDKEKEVIIALDGALFDGGKDYDAILNL